MRDFGKQMGLDDYLWDDQVKYAKENPDSTVEEFLAHREKITEEFLSDKSKESPEAANLVKEYRKHQQLKKEHQAEFDKKYAGIIEKTKGNFDGYTLYRKSAGETEARAAEDRADLTDEQRRNTPLSESEDTPRSDQFIEKYNQSAHENDFLTPDLLEKYNQTAYTGTGNIIWNNQWDLNYAGSNEGTAAFGYGAYSAENIAVPQNYRNFALPDNKNGTLTLTTKDGKTFTSGKNGNGNWADISDNKSIARKIFEDIHKAFAHNEFKQDKNFSFENVKDSLIQKYQEEILSLEKTLEINKKHNLKGFIDVDRIPERISFLQGAIKAVQSISDAKLEGFKKGNIYILDIPEDYELLDWDANLDEQPEQVKTGIKKIFAYLARRGYSKKEIVNDFSERGIIETGEDLYWAITNVMKRHLGYNPNPADGITDPKARTSFLFNKFGIPGHRYWDAFSRENKSGTHNYVIWNAKRIKFTGITEDSDEDAKRIFRDGGRKQLELFNNDNSEQYNQTARNADSLNISQQQIDAVRKKYEGTAQWLKAPNGKDTNLTEKQWLQVRTPAFKAWFGDWENDTKNASKVVDENGEPLVLYHQTENEFSIFDTKHKGAGEYDNETPYGIFMKPTNKSIGLAGNIQMALFANIRNPFIISNREDIRRHLKDNSDYIRTLDKIALNDKYYGNLVNTKEEEWSNEANNEQDEKKLDKIFEEEEAIVAEWKNKNDSLGRKGKEILTSWLQDNNYDSMIIESDNGSFGRSVKTYIALAREQVKSATDNNGNFDNSDPNIYHQSAHNLDKQYFDAIENGDMETARQIIETQAKEKGYSPDTDYRGQHQAPVQSDNYGPNMAELMDSDFVPKDYWTHPEYYLYSDEEWDAFYSVTSAIRKYKNGLENGKNYGIKVYRAVPKDVKENSFRNGDWVTPSRDYAVEHGKSSLNGNYRIIEKVVPLKHLWWNGDSIAEFGYDDSKTYAYKNTKNNRKLNDVIVRDRNGEIVPPSKRFSSRKSEVYHQTVPRTQNNQLLGQNSNGEQEVIFTPEQQIEAVRKKYEGTTQWLKAPNGKPTNLTEQQWLQVRTQNFKSWFGDWEAKPIVKNVRQFLENSNAVGSITGNEFQKDNSSPLVERVFNYYNETGNTVVNNKELGNVILDKRGIKDSSAHGLGREKAAAFALVPDVIRKGLVYDRNINWKGRGYDTAIIIANVKIGDEDYVCEVIVKKNSDKQGFYLHEVELKKNLDDVFKTVLNNGTSPKSRLIISDYARKAEHTSKVVDENGEPLVLYHGTNEKFSAFDVTRTRSNMDIQGSFFTRWDIDASGYGDNIIPVFLNLKNPANESQSYKALNKYAGQNKAGTKAREDLIAQGYDGIINYNEEFIAFYPEQVKSATDNTGEFDANNPEIYHQAVQNNPLIKTYSFNDPETERKYQERRKGVEPETIISQEKHSVRDFFHGLRGDFPELATKEAKAKGLIHAREILRIMNRKLGAQVQESTGSMAKSLKGLNPRQFDIFGRFMLLYDFVKFKSANPNWKLPLGFTDESLRSEYNKALKAAKADKAITDAINSEQKEHRRIKKELATLAEQLGMKKFAAKIKGYDLYMFSIAQQLKGDDINANYIQAVGEFRKEQLQDIARLQALLELRNEYDKIQELKQQYGKEWKQYIPEGYKVFNPLQAHFIKSDKTLTELALNTALEKLGMQMGLSEDTMKNLRIKLSDNSDSHLMILPKELADTLNKMAIPISEGRNIIARIAKPLTTGWKKIALYSPTRTIKYNFRNLTGDLDIVFAGNPHALFKLKQAISELAAYYYGKEGKVTDELKEFQKRGGAITIESTQELYNFKEMREFRHLLSQLEEQDASQSKKILAKVWQMFGKLFVAPGMVKATDFREQWLRYATYLDYLEQMQKNKDGIPNNFGASVREEVMSIPDIRDRAFKLANELIGAYDQVTETGKALRDIAVPFYSWLEVNAKRYVQLFKNGLSDNPHEFVGNFLKGQLFNVPYYGWKLGKTYFMIQLLSMLISAFNHFVFPDDEDKLPPDIQDRPHLTLGHDPFTGNVLYFDRVGSWLDVMEWFGQDNSTFIPFRKDVIDILDGRQTFLDFAAKVGKSMVNKAIGAINPLPKWLFIEFPAGRTLYPDLFNPRKVDRDKYIAQSLGLQWPYKAITGEPRSDWHELKNLFLYDTDADQAAYFYTLGKVREFQEKVLKRRFDGFMTTPRGEALRDLRTALRYDDKDAIKRSLEQYYSLNGKNQGLRTSLRNMYPLHSLNKREQQMFLEWLSPEDRKFLNRANKYYETILNRLE